MKGSIRTCAGCGAKRIKNEMIRVGLDIDGNPRVTGAGKCAGRGSYICIDALCVGKARKNGGLSRVLRKNIADRIYDKLELEIEDRQKVSSG